MDKKQIKSKSRNLFNKKKSPVKPLPTYVMPEVEKAQEQFVKELTAPGGGGIEIFQSPPAQNISLDIGSLRFTLTIRTSLRRALTKSGRGKWPSHILTSSSNIYRVKTM